MNSICLIGRLTKQPELKRTQSGKDVVSFNVAVDRRYSDGTDFIRCEAWEKTAQFISSNFLKGARIGIHGRLQVDTQEENTYYKVVVESVYFADGAKPKAEAPPQTFDNIEVEDGELPF